MRLHAFRISDAEESTLWARSALDILSCGAPVLIPRLAFNVMSENMLFLSLRAMMSDFLTLTALAVWCFAGFLLSLKWLHAGAHQVPATSLLFDASTDIAVGHDRKMDDLDLVWPGRNWN